MVFLVIKASSCQLGLLSFTSDKNTPELIDLLFLLVTAQKLPGH